MSDVEQQIKDYCARRDAAVLAGVEATIDFLAEQGRTFANWEAAEICMHQMRTGITSIPIEIRSASYRWLRARGLETEDDGDLQ